MSVQALKDDLYDKQRRVLQKVLECNIAVNKNGVDLDKWIEANRKYIQIFYDFMSELHMQDVVDLNMVILANKQFEMFLRKV